MIPEHIIASYSLKNETPFSQSELLFDQLEKFLENSARGLSINIPENDIDSAWHHFILYTKEYAKYCQDNFDKVIHHNPAKFKYVIEEDQITVNNPAFALDRCDDEE